jgi:excisionase family DNA binding protein
MPAVSIPDPYAHPTITVEQAAGILGISRSAAYRAVHNGTIPSVELSAHRWVVPTAALLRTLGFDVAPVGGAADA